MFETISDKCRNILEVEIPLHLPRDLPRDFSFFGVVYLLCTLVYLDKTADTHMTRAHIKACSVHLLLFRAPNSVKGGQRKEKRRGKVHLDMQICLSHGYVSCSPRETSLAYHVSPCMNLHLDTERHFKGGNNISV